MHLRASLILLAAAATAHAQCQSVRLNASDTATYQFFAKTLALATISGQPSLLVGTPDDTNAHGASAGAAYIFNRVGNQWAHSTKILPSDGVGNDWFGSGVSFADPYMVIGALGANHQGGK